MEIILTERVPKLGNIGDVVTVKDGFARNFLLPQKKALRATAEAKQRFEAERARIEAEHASKKVEAEKVAKTLDGKVVIVVRQAGDSGQLYGSVSSRDVAAALTNEGFNVARQQVTIPTVIKELGVHPAFVQLHGEVIVSIRVNVALSVEEANAQLQAADKVAGKSYGSEKKSEPAEPSDLDAENV
jgi:large subunit ribosomal protein L9